MGRVPNAEGNDVMSSGLALVRFPDGAVKVTEYHGTSDILHPYLADTYEEWKAQRTWDGCPEYEPDAEAVDIWAYYGSQFWWRGTATRRFVIDGIEPWGSEDQMGNWINRPVERHRETPDWVWAWLDEHMPETAAWERKLIASRTRA